MREFRPVVFLPVPNGERRGLFQQPNTDNRQRAEGEAHRRMDTETLTSGSGKSRSFSDLAWSRKRRPGSYHDPKSRVLRPYLQ